MSEIKGWWTNKEFLRVSDHGFDAPGMARVALAQDALENGKTVLHVRTEGVLLGKIEDCFKQLEDLGGHCIIDDPAFRTDKSSMRAYNWPDSCLACWVSDGDLEIRAVTNDPQKFEAFKALIETFVGPKASAGRVYVLVQAEGGPEIQSLGVAGEPLERGNYNPEALEDFDAVVADLQSRDPSGRLAIFDGEPGTGKTYMIRGLLAAVPDALFVVVPAHLIPELGNPSMINALLDTRRNKGEKPTVFLVEDADQCLAKRDDGNVSAVSALLNLGDGILGSLMDIRLVCTTNLKTNELDGAVVRPGRLTRKINVTYLEKKVAEALFERLTGKKVKIDEKLTLAQVYSLARDNGWKPVQVTRRPMGFGFSPKERVDFEDHGIDPADVLEEFGEQIVFREE
jgi:hypothetical protein